MELSFAYEEISEEEATSVLAGSRVHGFWGEVLDSLLSCGLKAVKIPLDDPNFKGKPVDTIYQGLKSIVKKRELKDSVQITKQNEQVYVFIRTES